MAMRGRTGAGIPPPRPPAAAVRAVYEEFKPMSEWVQQSDSNTTLLIYLPGFQKEQLKVTTEGRNILRVRGERLIGGNKWSRFQEDFQVPETCNMRGIRARFERGILTITMPIRKNLIPQIGSKVEPRKTQEENPLPTQNTQQHLPPTSTSSIDGSGSTNENKSSKNKDQDDIPPNSDPSITSVKQPSFQKPTGELEPSRKKYQNDIPPEDAPTLTSAEHKDETSLKTTAPQEALDEHKPTQGARNEEMEKNLTQLTDAKDKHQAAERKKSTETKKTTKSEMSTERSSMKQKECADDDFRGKGENKAKQSTNSTTYFGGGFGLGNFRQATKGLAGLNEERQLLVNMGVAALVIVAFGAYISYKLGAGRAQN